jgi:hypothetical protein
MPLICMKESDRQIVSQNVINIFCRHVFFGCYFWPEAELWETYVGQHVAIVSDIVPTTFVDEQAMLYPCGQIPGEK